MKPMKNIAAISLAVTIGLVMIIVGLLWMQSEDYTAYIPPIVGLGTAFMTMGMVGLKRLSNVSELKKLRAIDWMALVVSFLILAVSIMSLPVLGMAGNLLFNIAGGLLSLGGVFVMIEIFA